MEYVHDEDHEFVFNYKQNDEDDNLWDANIWKNKLLCSPESFRITVH